MPELRIGDAAHLIECPLDVGDRPGIVTARDPDLRTHARRLCGHVVTIACVDSRQKPVADGQRLVPLGVSVVLVAESALVPAVPGLGADALRDQARLVACHARGTHVAENDVRHGETVDVARDKLERPDRSRQLHASLGVFQADVVTQVKTYAPSNMQRLGPRPRKLELLGQSKCLVRIPQRVAARSGQHLERRDAAQNVRLRSARLCIPDQLLRPPAVLGRLLGQALEPIATA